MSFGFKTGYFGLERLISDYVLDAVGSDTFDVIWVDNGETIGKKLAAELRLRCKSIVNHNLDNPFNGRDGRRWRLFHQALPVYDLFVAPRSSSRDDALARGAARSIAVNFSADESVHRRVTLTDQDYGDFVSEVAFVGTWMPERGPFLKRVIERGVPLRIFGPRWNKAPERASLEPFVRCYSLNDNDYVKAISGAKIAIGLLSKGNLDLHTTRSLEIPAIGALFCAPRTIEHQMLYVDGEEAVFFDDADECAEACLALLADESRRRNISEAGHARALRNNFFNERICADILSAL
jgi:spore maturation protein CgeB